MGTWGAGNFENDGALDYLGDLVAQLEREIKDCLANEYRIALDEDGEAIFMPSIAVLSLLCEHYGTVPPEERDIVEWREKYLEVYDEQIEALEPQAGFKLERRKVIKDTFDKLLSLARNFQR